MTDQKGMTITYKAKNGIYVNMTNRCPCACTFCLRQNAPGVYGSDPLWLEREPTVEEVEASLSKWDLNSMDEVVFCGYGEPAERLKDLLEVAAWLKKNYTVKTRINTNGLADLIWGEPTAPWLEGKIDAVSISLNAIDAKTLIQAAEVLGCGRFRAYVQVVLPNIFSGILVSSLLAESIVFGDFVLANNIAGNNYENVSVYLNTNMYNSSGLASAIVVVIFAVVFLVTGLMLKLQKSDSKTQDGR